jgi:hypothetical protein
MSATSPALLAVVGLLEAGDREPLRFREGALPVLEQLVARLVEIRPAAAIDAIRELLGLQSVLAGARKSPSAARALGAVLVRTGPRRALVAKVEAAARRATQDAHAKLGGEPTSRVAARPAPPPGAMRASSLTGLGVGMRPIGAPARAASVPAASPPAAARPVPPRFASLTAPPARSASVTRTSSAAPARGALTR